MSKKYKYILFDWDGCLADTSSVLNSVCKDLAKLKGRSFTDQDFANVLGSWEKLAQVAGYTDLNELKLEHARLVSENMNVIGLNSNAKEVLSYLSEHNIQFGIVTSSSKQAIHQQAQYNSIDNLLKYIVGFEDVTNTKPHPEPILKMLEMLEADKSTALMVGDTESDLIAAKQAGIDSVWYNNLGRDADMPLATYVIDDLIKLQEWL